MASLPDRGCLVGEGLPAGDDDFIVPGAALDGHYTLEQQHNFIRHIKACGRVAAARDPEMSFLPRVTPYSLRRGHISAAHPRGRGHQAHR